MKWMELGLVRSVVILGILIACTLPVASQTRNAADKTEDAAHASGDVGTLALGVRNDAGTTLVDTDADYAPLQVDADGKLVVTTATPNTQYAEDSVHSSGDTGNLALVIVNDSPDAMAAEGDRSVLITDAESRLHTASLLVDSAGAALTLAADATHDSAAASSGPQAIGVAVVHGANPTAVSAGGDAVRLAANRAGVQFTIGGHPNIVTKTAQVTDADGAQTGVSLATVATGNKVVVTRASVKCSNANTVDVDFRLAFDTDTTLGAQVETGLTGEVMAFDDIPPGGGAVEGGAAGILGVGADDEDLRYSLSDPTTGSCNISVSYYTIES